MISTTNIYIYRYIFIYLVMMLIPKFLLHHFKTTRFDLNRIKLGKKKVKPNQSDLFFYFGKLAKKAKSSYYPVDL